MTAPTGPKMKPPPPQVRLKEQSSNQGSTRDSFPRSAPGGQLPKESLIWTETHFPHLLGSTSCLTLLVAYSWSCGRACTPPPIGKLKITLRDTVKKPPKPCLPSPSFSAHHTVRPICIPATRALPLSQCPAIITLLSQSTRPSDPELTRAACSLEPLA